MEIETITISENSRTVSVLRGDEKNVDIDVSVNRERFVNVSIYPMGRTDKLELLKIEYGTNGVMVLKFDLGEDDRNG